MILGIDQGTTGTRACLMDPDGKVTSSSYLPHRQYHPRAGWVEHDALEIWQNTEKVISDTLGMNGGRPMPIAVGIANQGETAVIWDKKTGVPLYNAIVWQDTRTQSEMDGLAGNSELSASITESTGLRPDPYFSADKIRWLLDNVEGARETAKKGRLCAGTMDSWLIWKLTGGKDFVTDPSTAARTLLFNIFKMDYDPFLLDLFDIPRSVLPEIRPTIGHFGTAALPHGVSAPITASLVDQPSAMLGEGCLIKGSTKATYGTGCFIYMNAGNSITGSVAENLEKESTGPLITVAWHRAGTTTYALDGGVFTVGSAVNWLRDSLCIIRSEKEIDAIAGSVDNTGGVVCIPAFTGLGPPFWDRKFRGGWLGIGLETGRAHMIRALLEGISYQVVEVVHSMERISGVKIQSLRVDGGLTESAVLMQMQANLLGTPIMVSAAKEASVMGACYLAAEGAGQWDDPKTMEQIETARVYEPEMPEDQRLECIDRLRKTLHKLRQRHDE